MRELPPVTDGSACRAWLAAQLRAYADTPCSAYERLEPALVLFDQVQALGPSDFGVELASYLAELLGELWRAEQIETVLDAVLPWVDAGFGEAVAVHVLALRCRMHLRFGRLSTALALLDQVTRRAAASPRDIDRAHCARALGGALSAQAQFEPAIAAMRDAITGYQACRDRGRWVDIYASISVAYRHLGERAAEQRTLQEGMKTAVAQKRWISACNTAASLAEELLTDGREAEAVPLLRAAEEYLRLAGPGGERIAKEVHAAQATLAARQGRLGEAIALMQGVVADTRAYSMRRQVVFRLKQLARWQLADGDSAAALATVQEAHQMELDETREGSRRDMALELQRIELAHAQQLKLKAEAYADELAARASALQDALDLQRELQAELIERSKLATLGHLLAGMAHELNTPLGSALIALSTATELSRSLAHHLADGGPVSRSRFTADLGRCKEGAELARRNVEQALSLVQTYLHIDAGHAPEPMRRVVLGRLVEAAWQRAVTPGSPLRLRCRADFELELPAEALTEVLLQLFQNIERHAYGADQEGVVDVDARIEGGQVLMAVADHGRGIACELQSRVFDPYVTTRFGQGRSGLGLFVAQVAVVQRLHGRITVDSRPGQGCRFDIEFPAAELSPSTVLPAALAAH